MLEFLSFVYFFPAFLGGPAFEYKRYDDFITGKYTHKTTDKVGGKDVVTYKQCAFAGKSPCAPQSWQPVLKCFCIGRAL